MNTENSTGISRKGFGIWAVCLLLLSVVAGGCGWVNMLKGPEDWNKNYEAEVQKELIDSAIDDELQKLPPSGFLTKGYSWEVWDVSWNRQINVLYKFEEDPSEKYYRGPTGAEFIRYIIKKRREKGLPEINVEDRNKGIIEAIEKSDKKVAS